MAVYTPLAPLSDAVFAVMQDPSMTTLVPGGVQTNIPINPVYPFLWIEVIEATQHGGFGTKPGQGALPECEIRLHAFSQLNGMAECHAIIAVAIALLSVANALSVTGYQVCGPEPFHLSTVPIPDQLVNGIKVDEVVSIHRVFVQEQ